MDAKEILIFSSRAKGWESIIGVYDNEDTAREQIREFFARRNDDTDGREEALELLLYGEYFNHDTDCHYIFRRVELNKTDYEACPMITKWGVCEIG